MFVLTLGTGIAGVQGCASAAAPSAAVVDWYPNVGAHMASVPEGLAGRGPDTPYFLSGNEYQSTSTAVCLSC